MKNINLAKQSMQSPEGLEDSPLMDVGCYLNPVYSSVKNSAHILEEFPVHLLFVSERQDKIYF